MNNLLIVDDEKEILEWLEELFLYEYAPEIEVFTASSGQEAVELLERIPFDVVLTDIKMPKMNGHKLFYKIKENWPRCKVIFLTGYRNFEDIYQIIQHNDVRYILKSEDDNKIVNAVDESFREIERMLSQEWISKIPQSDIDKAKAWLRWEAFRDLLTNPGNQAAAKQLLELGIGIDLSRRCLLALIRLQETGLVESNVKEERMKNVISGYLPEWIALYSHKLESGYFLLFFQPDSEHEANGDNTFIVTQGALEYAGAYYERCQPGVYGAVSSSQPQQLHEVSGKLEQLKKVAIGYLCGNETAILHAETILEQQTEVVSGFAERNEQAQMLKYYLGLRQQEDYFKLLGSLCGRMASGKGRHDLVSMEIYYSIAVIMLQFINENHLQEKLAFEIGLYKLLNSNEHDGWTAAGEYLIQLSKAIFLVLGYFADTLTDRALDRIIAYIDKNIAGDLSLTNLARIGGFNSSYLSRLFKQIHRVTISDYVYRKRMEMAKHCLAASDKRIQEVAEQNGYISSHSFSRAFRSYTGVSPIEYREVHRRE